MRRRRQTRENCIFQVYCQSAKSFIYRKIHNKFELKILYLMYFSVCIEIMTEALFQINKKMQRQNSETCILKFIFDYLHSVGMKNVKTEPNVSVK